MRWPLPKLLAWAKMTNKHQEHERLIHTSDQRVAQHADKKGWTGFVNMLRGKNG